MIALFDSGLGGLSILQSIERLLPSVPTAYLADTAQFPYGTKTESEVRDIALQAAAALMRYRPSILVVACNTASTSALDAIRRQFPDTPVVGVVPAIKPAAQQYPDGPIAVLATERTLASSAYAELKAQFATDGGIIDQPCPGWVELVESGHVDDEQARNAVETIVQPLIRRGVTTFVLGCTHYPFLRDTIAEVAGRPVAIFDSGEAVARQAERLMNRMSITAPAEASHRFFTSGDPSTVGPLMSRLLGHPVVPEKMQP